jgi:hypothetical protein
MTATTLARSAGPPWRLALGFAAVKLLFQFALTIYTQHLG